MFCAQMPFLINKFLANVCQAGYFVRYNGLARGVVGYPFAVKRSLTRVLDFFFCRCQMPRMIMIAFFFLFVLLFAWRCACQLFFRGRGSMVHVGTDDNEEKWEWCSWMEPLSSTPARPFLAIVWQTTIKILNVILYVRQTLCPSKEVIAYCFTTLSDL